MIYAKGLIKKDHPKKLWVKYLTAIVDHTMMKDHIPQSFVEIGENDEKIAAFCYTKIEELEEVANLMAEDGLTLSMRYVWKPGEVVDMEE